ncbi:MAG: Ppx/GppA phosphatase family protein [Pseudomonadota bacterium]
MGCAYKKRGACNQCKKRCSLRRKLENTVAQKCVTKENTKALSAEEMTFSKGQASMAPKKTDSQNQESNVTITNFPKVPSLSSMITGYSMPAASSHGLGINDSGKVIGLIDLGSNSARLLIVRLLPSGSYAVLNRVKHMVRLGENAFQKKLLQEDAMQRTLVVLQAFAGMCKTYGAHEVVAMATAAARDAGNAKEFLVRVRALTGLNLSVISGREEARLIYLGVSGGLPHSLAKRLYIDIGGGSTELVVANSDDYDNLDSLKLGCVRLTNRFLVGHTGAVSPELFAKICQYVRNKAGYDIQRVQQFDIAEVVGSSGTALTLHSIAHRLQHGVAPTPEQNTLTLDALRQATKYICGLTAEERLALPSVSERRAEVLVAGAAILLTILEDLNLSSMIVSQRNLQDGMLMDYMLRKGHGPTGPSGPIHSVREMSILQLAHRCNFEERHARHTARLALHMHDSAVDCGLIPLHHSLRELLYYAALLHDIGIFIAYAHHAEHSAYLIRNAELLGFNEEEVSFIALLTQFHSKRPSKKYEAVASCEPTLRANLRMYSLFLALAENLDRLHGQQVYDADFIAINDDIVLTIASESATPVELDAVYNMQKHMKKVFNTPVSIEIVGIDGK